MAAERRYNILFLADRLEVRDPIGVEPVVDVPLDRLRGLMIGGPGVQTATSGGGFMGGGFGLVGFAVGVATAAVLNAATRRTKTSVQTLLRVETGAPSGLIAEADFLITVLTPEQLEQVLKGLLLRLRQLDEARRSASSTPQVSPPPSKVDQLKELAALHESGAITDEEFAFLKAEVVQGQGR